MDDNLRHIDKLYRDTLADYVPESRKNFGWIKLGLKLLIFNLGSWSLFAAATLFVATTATVVYVVIEPEPLSFYNNKAVSESETQLITKNETLLPIKPKGVQQINSSYFHTPEQRSNYTSDEVGLIISEKEEEITSPTKSSPNKTNFNTPVSKHGNANLNIHKTANYTPGTSKLIKNDKSFFMNSLSQELFVLSTNTSKIQSEHTFEDSLSVLGIKSRRLSLELFLNPSMSFGNGSASPTAVEIDKSMIFSLGFGADLKFHFNNWFVQTGLNYSQYGQNTNYQLSKEIPDPEHMIESIDTTFHWYYDPPYYGEPMPVAIDTNWIPGLKTINQEQRTTTKISFIEIPILAGYQWQLGKLSIDASTGISFGIPIKNNGSLPSSNNSEFVSLENIKIAEPLINYVFQAGLSIPYKERINVFVKPNIKYNLNSIYDDTNNSANQHFFSIGIKIGITIDM